jgi:FdhD protein
MSTRTDPHDVDFGVREVQAWFVSAPGAPIERQTTRVVEESMISIDVAGVGWYSLMWTPTASAREVMGFTAGGGVMAATDDPEVLALTAGFLYTEGLIESMQDVVRMEVCANQAGVVRVELAHPEKLEPRRRNVVMGSSCGVCGGREGVENVVAGLAPVGSTMSLDSRQFGQIAAAMRKLQTVFGQTGGAHAAAVFDRESHIIAVAEDLGRHNALDKVIGKCLLCSIDPRGCGVVLSSRLSLEMMTKAIRAGFEVVAAVSAPTSLAIEVGERFGVTLCGFVRGGRATIYCHPQRIAGGSEHLPAG